MRRSEHAVVAGEVPPRRWDRGGERAEELRGLERDVGAAVEVSALELDDSATALVERRTAVGERGAGAMAAEALESFAVVEVDMAVGVEGVAEQKGRATVRSLRRIGSGDTRSRLPGDVCRVECEDVATLVGVVCSRLRS
jgi:hypothetical protein